MSTFIGIPLYVLRFFLNSNVFINIHEYKDIIDCIFDHYEKKIGVNALISYQICYLRTIRAEI